MLPSESKVFEKIMHKQIYEHFDNSNLFFNSQYGFRSQHSTDLAVLELIERIITDMDKNNVPINIYLDLSKAFDTLDHDVLLVKLQHYGFFGKSYELMKSYLSNRYQCIQLNNTISDLLPVTVGVPQAPFVHHLYERSYQCHRLLLPCHIC